MAAEQRKKPATLDTAGVEGHKGKKSIWKEYICLLVILNANIHLNI